VNVVTARKASEASQANINGIRSQASVAAPQTNIKAGKSLLDKPKDDKT
jgi:hypothetical protein